MAFKARRLSVTHILSISLIILFIHYLLDLVVVVARLGSEHLFPATHSSCGPYQLLLARDHYGHWDTFLFWTI